MNGLDFSQSIVGGAYTLSLVLRLRPPLHVIITHLYVACMFVCVYANNCHMLIDSRLSRCRCAVCRVNYSRLIWHTRHHCAPVSSTPCRRTTTDDGGGGPHHHHHLCRAARLLLLSIEEAREMRTHSSCTALIMCYLCIMYRRLHECGGIARARGRTGIVGRVPEQSSEYSVHNQ